MGMYTANADVAQETANLEFAVATVNRLRPAFVIVTGDLVNRAGDGEIEMVTSGPIGMPLGGGKSGLRVVTVSDAGLEHRYYELGELPAKVTLPR